MTTDPNNGYKLGGLYIGVVQSEEVTKDAQLFQMPMPMQDSNKAIVMDLFGAAKTITIKGTYTSDIIQHLVIFVNQLHSYCNGKQNAILYQSGFYYDINGSVITYPKVFVTSVAWNYESGSPNTLSYTIVMQEAYSSTVHIIPDPFA